jgi:NhaP-type Na+/H+ and K+/H+ antiporters with a unique C-terminal domain
MVDAAVIFSAVAGIIVIGFAGEFFMKKTGIPIFIFLIATGIILGPVLNIFPRDNLLPVLALFATLTVLMVLFYGGLGLKSQSVVKIGARTVIQAALYVLTSTALIGVLGILVLGWDPLQSFIFASMIGGETTAAVVVPLSYSMKLKENTVAFLTMESGINSVFSIVLFSTFMGIYTTGESGNWFNAITNMTAQFSVGIILGVLLGIAWVYILYRFQKQKFTYVLTLAFILITYGLTEQVGGNGTLAVLIFGMVLGNYYLINKIFKTKMNMDDLQIRLKSFYEEISFLLETLFFVSLGLTLLIDWSFIMVSVLSSVMFLAVLLFSRFAATRVSTFRSELSEERRLIVMMCAQGLIPATLAILAVTFELPLANTFVNIVTYVIILTNVVTTVGAILYRRRHGELYNAMPEVEANKLA